MNNFFVDKSQIIYNKVEIVGENANHLINVLKCKSKQQITVFCGDGLEYLCQIESIEKNKVVAKILDCFKNATEPNVKITLFQSLPKGEKMDFIIQKSVEIGVDTIVPILTNRTIVKINDKEQKKVCRWNKISESAAKQSRRGKIPKVENVLTFKDALFVAQSLDTLIIPYEEEKINTIKNFAKNFTQKSVGIFIGPEGGFSQDEIDLAIKNNVLPITLGNRILRTETAGLFTSIILIYERDI